NVCVRLSITNWNLHSNKKGLIARSPPGLAYEDSRKERRVSQQYCTESPDHMI
ncbi:hypothetical protein CEXT_161261, partial [Caerostris extrusa]